MTVNNRRGSNLGGRRGSYYATFALSLPVLIGFTAMGVDWGMVAVARNQVQTAADSSALAAVSAMNVTDLSRAQQFALGRTRAHDFAAQVVINGHPAIVDNNKTDVVYGNYKADATPAFDPDANEDGLSDGRKSPNNCAKVIARVDIDLPFTSTFRRLLGGAGGSALTVRQVAGAAPNATPGRAPDTVISLDVTASMSSAELDQESKAAIALVDCVHTNSTGTSRAGVSKFTGVDVLGLAMTDYGTHYTDLFRAVSRQATLTPKGIGGCVGSFSSWELAGSNDPDCGGYTNQAAGLAAARYILETASTPSNVGQAVVLFSDGEPMSGDGAGQCSDANLASTSVTWNSVSAPNLLARCQSLPHKCYRNNTSDEVTGTTVDTEAECESLGRCEGGTNDSHRNKDKVSAASCPTGSGHNHTWTRHDWSYPTDIPNADGGDADTMSDVLVAWAQSERDLLMDIDTTRRAAGSLGLDIYTVYYANPMVAEHRTYMESLATDPSKAYDVTVASDLTSVFNAICISTQTGDPGPLF